MEIWYMWSLLSLLSSLSCFLNSIIMVVTSMKNLHHNHNTSSLSTKTGWQKHKRFVVAILTAAAAKQKAKYVYASSWTVTQAKPCHMGEKTNKPKGPRHDWGNPTHRWGKQWVGLSGFHRNCGSNRTSMCLIGSRAALPTKSNKSFVRISCAKKPWVELSFCQGQPCMVMAQGSSILERHADDL